jgi:hypothetical protein
MRSRGPASVEVVALMRKPDAATIDVPVKYVGFEIANEFVVGYGLDYAERYRDLPFVGPAQARGLHRLTGGCGRVVHTSHWQRNTAARRTRWTAQRCPVPVYRR